MQFDRIDYTIGAHFMPALFNGDYTGLTGWEGAELDSFLGVRNPRPPGGHWEALDEREEFARCEVTGYMGACERVAYMFPVEAQPGAEQFTNQAKADCMLQMAHAMDCMIMDARTKASARGATPAEIQRSVMYLGREVY